SLHAALPISAMDLALDDHRVDDGAEIVDGGPCDDLALAGLRIDFDLTDVTSGGKGKRDVILYRPLLQTGLQLRAHKLVGDIGVERDVAPGRRLVSPGNRELAVLEHDVAFPRFPE